MMGLQLLCLRLEWSKSNSLSLSLTKETYKLFPNGTFLLQPPPFSICMAMMLS